MTELIVRTDAHLLPALSMAGAVERFNAVATFASRVLRVNVDYGVIPGTGTVKDADGKEKPRYTLLKPGAEKLTTFFGLSVRFQILEKVEDWMGATTGGSPFFYYLYRCQLWRDDMLVAESDGSCNSRETKYRYRQADRLCPQCGTANIKRSKQQDRRGQEPGWYCYAKIGGCGAQFDARDPLIIDQQTGRTDNLDVADQVNTIQKMAQKRALVAATLLAVNASEFFTQDMDDLIIPAEEGAQFETKVIEDVPPPPAPSLPPRVRSTSSFARNTGPVQTEPVRRRGNDEVFDD